MMAHKVPATYYDGWAIHCSPDRFYVFNKNDLSSSGMKTRYRNIKKYKPQHNFFIEEDFYYIDWSIKGISFKVKPEITDFLVSSGLSIKCVDDLAIDEEKEEIIRIDSYDKFISYQIQMDNWIITTSDDVKINPVDFKLMLNDYIFSKVGVLIEENYFANYLENMWNDLKASIDNDISTLKAGDEITLSRKIDVLEFFVIQYLRCDKRIKTDIEPMLDIFKSIFIDMGADERCISEMKNDGLLSSSVYFYGILLDAARGDKTRIRYYIDLFDKNYCLDVLQAPKDFSFLTSNFPCVFSKKIEGSKEEILFPIKNSCCLRFRRKHNQTDLGKYILLTSSELQSINNDIVSGIGDIIISEYENIDFLL